MLYPPRVPGRHWRGSGRVHGQECVVSRQGALGMQRAGVEDFLPGCDDFRPGGAVHVRERERVSGQRGTEPKARLQAPADGFLPGQGHGRGQGRKLEAVRIGDREVRIPGDDLGSTRLTVKYRRVPNTRGGGTHRARFG